MNETQETINRLCRHCKESVHPQATRCPHCQGNIKQWYKKWWGAIIAILFFPIVLPYLVWKETSWSRSAKIAVTVICVILLVVAQGDDQPSVTSSVTETTPPTSEEKPTSNVSITPAPPSVEIPKYSVVHESSTVRYDGGKVFYVLIDPIDRTSSDFKEKIKALVKKIATKENKKKVSILIFDKESALDLYYKQYVEMSLGRVRTEAESENLSIHLIATYDGDLQTMHPTNSLSFFPSAFSDNSVVGQHIETVEFDANL